MSQENIEDYLKKHAGEKFSADELKSRLLVYSGTDLGQSIYDNLRKLRPKCPFCKTDRRGNFKDCLSVTCQEVLSALGSGVRADRLQHGKDSRGDVWVYWWQEEIEND